MDSEENVHRLEGSGNEKGGLIVTKKPSVFKIPQPSLFGLDKLAAQKRKEKAEAARKMSFNMDDDDSNEENDVSIKQRQEKDNRKFRSPQEETPTYTGGLSKEARDRLIERLNFNKYKEKGVYASTKTKKSTEKDDDKGEDYYRERRRDREREHERNRKRERYKSSDKNSERREKTPRFKDEPKTPNIKLRDGTSKSSWDEDDEPTAAKKSAWDYPTPTVYKPKGTDWSDRSSKSYDKSERSHRDDRKSSSRDRYKTEDDTPRPTPAHRYNVWAKDRKKTGATPNLGKDKDESLKWDATVDRENWEEEQKRLDREWYNMDEGYDDEHNPFSSVSDEYTKKKEEQLEQRKKKRLSAQQRQINKDNELWERNRMLTSGM